MNSTLKYIFDKAEKRPYDNQPEKQSWSHKVARAIAADLCDRGGIKYEMFGVEKDVRNIMIDEISEIIEKGEKEFRREAKKTDNLDLKSYGTDTYELTVGDNTTIITEYQAKELAGKLIKELPTEFSMDEEFIKNSQAKGLLDWKEQKNYQ